MSVIYCSPACRDLDKEEHQISCFMHPGWECKEAEKQRAAMAIEAGKGVQEARVSEEKSEILEVDVNELPGVEAQKSSDLESEPEQQLDAQGQLLVQQQVANNGDEGILKDSSDASA